MRVAQVAPLIERVPPVEYGGTERVVSYLTEALVAQGHEVTLFASSDSITGARLVPACGASLRCDRERRDPLPNNVLELEKVFQQANSFDVIHFHIDYFHFPLSRRHSGAHLTTLHGRLDTPDLAPLFHEFAEIPVVSISDAQRAALPQANWQATVYHGIPHDLYRFQNGQGNYLAFLGRVSPEKRLDRAVAIAKAAKMKLKIAAKVDAADRQYMERDIRPLLDDPLVEFIGEIADEQKQEFLGSAYALLFPIDWCEPFGLVMIEAMACGTPVIAYNRGSVSEVVDNGVTGFIVNDIRESVDALDRLEHLDRRRCRQVFEERFTAKRMADDYLRVYQALQRERPRNISEKPKMVNPAPPAIDRVDGQAGIRSGPRRVIGKPTRH